MFKYDEYPEIKKAHSQLKKLRNAMYKAEFASEKSGGAKSKEDEWQKAHDSCVDFKLNVYARVIYNFFTPMQPMLTEKSSGKIAKWSDVFHQGDFSKLDNDQKKMLVLIVDDERPYRLPDKYYNDKDWFEEQKKKDEKSFLKKIRTK